jgi:uncharacterized protein (DUF1697 family)
MKRKLILILGLTFITLLASAQKRDSINNEDLTRYAVMMDSVQSVQKKISNRTIELARGNSKITPARYTALLPLADDQKKLTEAKATPDEIAYVKKALAIRTEDGLKLSNTFQALMNEYVGYDTFNRVKAAIASDPKVKRRYDLLMASYKD